MCFFTRKPALLPKTSGVGYLLVSIPAKNRFASQIKTTTFKDNIHQHFPLQYTEKESIFVSYRKIVISFLNFSGVIKIV